MNIVITGASSGIGQALAAFYAADGTNLFLTGRNPERLEQVAHTCRLKGAHVTAQIIDVGDQNAMYDFIVQADKQAPLNLVIANAGIGLTDDKHPTADSLKQARKTFLTNTAGVLNTIDPVIPLFAERQSGQIALVSSIAGYAGMPSCPMYAATKNFVRAYGEGLRGSLKKHGIRVSVICPGFVESRITAQNTCPMPFIMTADKAARIIALRLAKNDGCIAFPKPMVFGAWFLSILPSFLRYRLSQMLPDKI